MAGPYPAGRREETTEVDDVPDGSEDDVTRTDRPEARPETTGPPTDRVRIFGAEPAGEITRAVPAVSRDAGPATEAQWPPPPAPGEAGPTADDGPSGTEGDELGQPKVRLTGEPAAPDSGVTVVHPVNPGQTAVPSSGGAATELPHWTEPPTGQVPAVLARDSGDEGSGIGAPSWREEDADWIAHDEEFEPAMFGDDDVALGSLDETDSTDVDRRPWEFDLDSVRPGAASPSRPSDGVDREGDDISTIAPITEPTEVVAPLAGDAGPGRGDSEGSTGGPHPTDAAAFHVHRRGPSDRSIRRSSGRGRRRRRRSRRHGGRDERPRPGRGRARRRRTRSRRPCRSRRRRGAVHGGQTPADRGDPSGPGPAQRATAGPDAGQAAR